MILNYLDISTGHIKENNSNHVLETKGVIFHNLGLYGFPYDEGTFISIGEIIDEDLLDLRDQGFDELAKIVEYCKANDISLIRFDMDADIMEEFETFEW